jgi:ATP-dependent 26S proteasome regulatory subunit
MEFRDHLTQLIRAGYQALFVATAEEARCEAELSRVAEGLGMGFVTWDAVAGFSHNSSCQDPTEALNTIPGDQLEKNTVVVLRDFHPYLEDPLCRRAFRSLCETNALVNSQHKRPLVMLSPVLKIHEEIAASVCVLEFDLPGTEQLVKTVSFIEQSVKDKTVCPAKLRDRVVQALRGLTSVEAENCLSLCLVRHGGFMPEMIDTIEDQKAATLKKSEVLTYVPKDRIAGQEQIGGYEELLNFIGQRALAYTPEARKLSLDLPKGIVLLGPPGTGKSMVGKGIARMLGLPLVILDFASVFDSLVGESERRMKDALRTVGALDGCVLLIDEADKAFGGAVEANGDSGVTRRLFGQILTWLTDKDDRTFVVLTMNRTRGIPPELVRKGRFDEVFFTDLPDEAERRTILAIHLKKRGIDPRQYGEKHWEQFVRLTNDFVGSELEEAVKAARFLAFQARGDGSPKFEELAAAITSTIPIARLDAENIKAIREFCKNRARPVARCRDTSPRMRAARNVSLN